MLVLAGQLKDPEAAARRAAEALELPWLPAPAALDDAAWLVALARAPRSTPLVQALNTDADPARLAALAGRPLLALWLEQEGGVEVLPRLHPAAHPAATGVPALLRPHRLDEARWQAWVREAAGG